MVQGKVVAVFLVSIYLKILKCQQIIEGNVLENIFFELLYTVRKVFLCGVTMSSGHIFYFDVQFFGLKVLGFFCNIKNSQFIFKA